MPRVHGERLATRGLRETRAGPDQNVAVLDQALALLGAVSRNVLHEAAVAYHVEDLEAAANTEDRKVTRDRGFCDLDLERVAVGIDVGAGHVCLTVPG